MSAETAPAVVGYARVSTDAQSHDLQMDALAQLHPVKVFVEKASTRTHRPQLAAMLEYVRAGDQVAVWKLDRLGRSLKEILHTVETLDAQGVQLLLITEKIDTSTVSGKLMFHIMAAFAEAERDLISERTKAGLAAAAARGRKLGRPSALNEEKRQQILDMRAKGNSIASIARTFDVGRATVRRALQQA